MEFFNSLNLTQIKGGTKLKQGDLGSVLSYSLTDENGQEITSFDNKTAYINLVLDDKIWFTTTTLVDLSRVTFRIDKAIPIGLYYLEIKIDDYIFPSDRDSIILIEEGSTPYDLKELVPNYDINMTIKGILSDLSQKGIDISDLKTKMNAIYNIALDDHTEVAKARGSYETLGERIQNLTFADVNKNFGKIDQTMLSPELLSQIAGTTAINAIPADRSVIESMTTFFENVRSTNLFNRDNVRDGYYSTSGVWTANAGFKTATNYMIVKPSTQYTFRATIDVATHLVSWFTSGGTFIKTEALSTATETKTSPSNAGRAYFTATSRGLATYTVAEGSSATTDTTFFDKWLLKNSLFEIEDNSITADMTNFFEVKESTNLFDRDNVRNGYISTSGAFVANEGYRVSDTWIPVHPNEKLTVRALNNTGSVLYSFYSKDEDSGWLATKALPTASQVQTITVPVDAKFAKFTCASATVDTFTVARGTQPTTDTRFFRYTAIKAEYLQGLGLGQSSVIQVDKVGDIKSVRDAVNSIKDEGTVRVNSGTYIEDIDAIGKTVHLVGINKNSTIIRTENSSRETPPLEVTSGSVSNMTFYANWPSGMIRPSDGRTPYAAHIDYDAEANKTLVIEDCVLNSDWNAGVGIGMRVGFNLVFRRCKLHSGADGLGGVFFHDATTDSLRGESWITFEDCEITSDGRHALSIQAQGTEQDIVNCKFVRCNIYSKRAGKTINWSDNANSVLGATVASHLKGDNLFGTKNFRLDPSSYGNNLDYFNA